MIAFTLSTQLDTSEYFNPQIGSFTILDELTTDENGTMYLQISANLVQNHSTPGNKTARNGIYPVPKAYIDALQIDPFLKTIGNKEALVGLMNQFNIRILNDEYQQYYPNSHVTKILAPDQSIWAWDDINLNWIKQ